MAGYFGTARVRRWISATRLSNRWRMFARRIGWARNPGAISAITEAMKLNPGLLVTLPTLVNEEVLSNLGITH